MGVDAGVKLWVCEGFVGVRVRECLLCAYVRRCVYGCGVWVLMPACLSLSCVRKRMSGCVLNVRGACVYTLAVLIPSPNPMPSCGYPFGRGIQASSYITGTLTLAST